MRLSEQQRVDLVGMFPWRFLLGSNPQRLNVEALNAVLPLDGLRVFEPGCFEGAVTVDLCKLGATVDATDPRPVNVVRAFARALYEGVEGRCTFGLGTAEDAESPSRPYDLVWHSGLLYHLSDPVLHLQRLKGKYSRVFLESHVLLPEPARPGFGKFNRLRGYGGRFWARERGWGDTLSGIDSQSFWLYRDELLRLCRDVGWTATVLREVSAPLSPRMSLLLQDV